MLIIPINPVPSQSLSVLLADQDTSLTITQRDSGMYIDVYVNDVLVIGGVICQAINRIVRNAYLGFAGDLIFIDNDNEDADPYYTGLGTRWSLAYLTVADLDGADG